MKQLFIFVLVLGLAVSAFAGRIEITNGTDSYDFYYVYISNVNDTEWGEDKLGSSEIITPGYTRSFNVRNGDYDIKIVDEDDDEYIYYDVPVSGTFSWYVTLDDLGETYYSSNASVGDGDEAITIYNDLGSYDIYYIYASPSASDDWGSDWLGSEILYPDESYTFWVNGGRDFDIYCEDEDGDTYTLMNVWVGSDGFYWSVDLGDID